ncbi:MAG: carbamoyltransferase [Candidatus Eiseniibacteriota bacterium]|jgi:carbamoyltransferase
MNILGISAFYHDAAAALYRNGALVAAASEERFTRRKHDAGYPEHAIRYCLEEGGIGVGDLDYVGFYEKPLIKFERILYTYFSTFPRSYRSFLRAMPLWLKEKLWIPGTLRHRLGYGGPLLFSDHHESHAASAFLVSPFERAAILTVDGVGEWSTASLGRGEGTRIELLREIRFPHSLGLLYTAFTYYLGFKVNSAEYKVMGLAPYGEPRYLEQVEQVAALDEDGSFRLDLDYFDFHTGLRMTGERFNALFGGPPRRPDDPMDQRHFDIAASIQRYTEEAVLRLGRHVHGLTGESNLCMAGGVALNCVANGRLLREGPFDDIWIQPAAGDAGGAIGVAALIHHSVLGNEGRFVLPHAYWGPGFDDGAIRAMLEADGVPFQELDRQELLETTARLIEDQQVIGWFQGRMEFGPRALGNRSIIADPRNPENKDRVNLKIKFRESFRPFAPTVLADRASDYFEIDRASPYMLLTAQVREDRRVIPSVTHLDGSARLQTIARDDNPLYYDLIREFEKRTGVPVIINTSFNVRGEPIVCTPADAYRCFLRTDMDYLVLHRFLVAKSDLVTEADAARREVAAFARVDEGQSLVTH